MKIPVGKICSKCKGQLYSVEYYQPGRNGASEEIICLACGDRRGSAQECEIFLKMIVTPPLDDLRLYQDGYATDLRKIQPQNRYWRYIAGQIFSKSRPVDEYFLAVYTLLVPHSGFTPHIGNAGEYYWKLEDYGGLGDSYAPGGPIIKPDKQGIWKAIVDVGYAYFILVTKGVLADVPSKTFYQTRLPFENLDRVILTHLIRTKEVFHPGSH